MSKVDELKTKANSKSIDFRQVKYWAQYLSLQVSPQARVYSSQSQYRFFYNDQQQFDRVEFRSSQRNTEFLMMK